MIRAIVSDFSKVLLFAKDPNYVGGLNALRNDLLKKDHDFTFFEHFVLNQELLDFYKRINQNTPVYIFTSGTIQSDSAIPLTLQNSFTKIFSALDLNVHKSDPAAYKEILSQIELLGEEVIYLDDKKLFIENAQKYNMHAHQYINNTKAIAFIKKLIFPKEQQ